MRVSSVTLSPGMTLLAGLPVFGCMLVMSAPALADIHVLAFRLFYLAAYLVWIVPLGWMQRYLWARKVNWRLTVAVLLPVSYAMSVGNALLALRPIASESMRTRADWTWIFGGLDGCWLALIAFCGIQAIILHRAALLAEGERLRESAQAARDATDVDATRRAAARFRQPSRITHVTCPRTRHPAGHRHRLGHAVPQLPDRRPR